MSLYKKNYLKIYYPHKCLYEDFYCSQKYLIIFPSLYCIEKYNIVSTGSAVTNGYWTFL